MLDYLPYLFFFIALIYSSAGFGGGSSYLAVLSLVPMIDFTEMRILALLCNLTVVTGSVLLFYREKLLLFARILPLVCLSVPFAYLGGTLQISRRFFFVVLGCTLFAAAVLMLFSTQGQHRKLPRKTDAVIGAGIGFLSGLVGIGGGIFLSPVLYLSRWAPAKNIAACTAFFILVNSAAGLAGQIVGAGFVVRPGLALSLTGAVFIGGQLGARLTIFKLPPILVKRVTGFLILTVAVRLLFKYVPGCF